MTSRFKSEENFNELIFENRNKDYGAYEIRSGYANTMTKSTAFTLSGVSLLICILVYASKTTINPSPPIEANLTPDTGIVINIRPPQDPKFTPPAPKAPTPPNTNNMNFKPTDEPVDSDPKPVDQGTPGLVNTPPADSSNTSEVPTPPSDPLPPVDNNEVHPIADVMPEFDGDVYQFVHDHTRYPQVAVENGTQGTVYVSFVIEKDGTVGETKVLGSKVGDGCTEEALRVVKMMPKWKPGKIHGNAVRVIINLPVRFHLRS